MVYYMLTRAGWYCRASRKVPSCKLITHASHNNYGTLIKDLISITKLVYSLHVQLKLISIIMLLKSNNIIVYKYLKKLPLTGTTLRVRKLPICGRFFSIHSSRYMIARKHWHLWNFIKIKETPIDERIMHKRLNPGRTNNQPIYPTNKRL